jgi:hypothetical protein
MAPPEAVTEHLRRGRRFHAAGSWSDAYEALSLADRSGELGGADLELLATSVFMLGRDEEYLLALERAYAAHVEDGELLGAARCAFWLGLSLLRGEPLRGNRHEHEAGSAGGNGCSTVTEPPASSTATSCCRS